MMGLRAVLLMPEKTGAITVEIAKETGVNLDVQIVHDLKMLECAFAEHRDLLLSFGTGILVPSWILDKQYLLAVNVHAASPHYPGRDPHHFAIYDGAEQYGATMHLMTKNVDAGPIVDVELFDVPDLISPSALLGLANDAGWVLIKRFFQKYITEGPPQPRNDIVWGVPKRTRKMFLDLCRVDSTMSESEIERRLRATEMPGYKNLYVEIHGYRFWFEGTSA